MLLAGLLLVAGFLWLRTMPHRPTPDADPARPVYGPSRYFPHERFGF